MYDSSQSLHGFKAHARQVAKALDQLVNALLGGYCDECISSRAYRHQGQLGWRIAMCCINALFLNCNHCKESFERDQDLPSCYKRHP